MSVPFDQIHRCSVGTASWCGIAESGQPGQEACIALRVPDGSAQQFDPPPRIKSRAHVFRRENVGIGIMQFSFDVLPTLVFLNILNYCAWRKRDWHPVKAAIENDAILFTLFERKPDPVAIIEYTRIPPAWKKMAAELEAIERWTKREFEAALQAVLPTLSVAQLWPANSPVDVVAIGSLEDLATHEARLRAEGHGPLVEAARQAFKESRRQELLAEMMRDHMTRK